MKIIHTAYISWLKIKKNSFMMESARYSIHCNTYSTLFLPQPNMKSFLNELDLLIHCSVPFSFLHSTQLCWIQESLGRIGAMWLSFIMCTLTPQDKKHMH